MFWLALIAVIEPVPRSKRQIIDTVRGHPAACLQEDVFLHSGDLQQLMLMAGALASTHSIQHGSAPWPRCEHRQNRIKPMGSGPLDLAPIACRRAPVGAWGNRGGLDTRLFCVRRTRAVVLQCAKEGCRWRLGLLDRPESVSFRALGRSHPLPAVDGTATESSDHLAPPVQSARSP